MKIESRAKLMTIYVNSKDQRHGKPLFAAIVELCEQKGLAGVTVSRALEGYGAGHQLHAAHLLDLTENVPVRIEIIDVPERIEVLLTALDGLIGEGVVTARDVVVRRYLAEPSA